VVGVFSPGIYRIPHLAELLGARDVVFRPDLLRRHVDVVVGWGRKQNTGRARRWAEENSIPFVYLEDGFLRSVGLGVDGAPPLSIVVDDRGIHYDATLPSRIEDLLARDPLDDPELLARARDSIARIRRHRLSKFNVAPVVDLGRRRGDRVLVVDQTAGDLSVALAMAVPGGFTSMVDAALEEHPDAEVLVKTHPNVSTGEKRGHLTSERRVRLLTEPMNPLGLLEQVDRVYVMSSLMGFEALLVGLPVTCFGVPFYAGWGLTDDRVRTERRGRERTVEQVFAAAYLKYARYVDPETGERCELERIISHLALQRAMADENRGTSVCVGFSAWRRGFAPAFLRSPGARIEHATDAETAERRLGADDARLVVWASRETAEVRALAERYRIPLWRMEDGFLRSVGLGSDLVVPASLVVDRTGIYYDPTRPSDLERLLEGGGFAEAELDRARSLRESIVAAGISKYNVGARAAVGTSRREGQTVALVVGQVEDDASIELGCVSIRTNRELLRTVRERRPDAFIVFKPHPDVVSGNRRGAVPDASELADEVVSDATLDDCLHASDEVHTLTSLVGFEALLRGIRVFVYGQPFYAGWGLTTDEHPHPRRSRRVSLDELACATLLRYPRYVSRRSEAFTTPERVVEELQQSRRDSMIRASWARRQLRKVVNLVRGMAHAP
jgi:capsular polysaccharide export protein